LPEEVGERFEFSWIVPKDRPWKVGDRLAVKFFEFGELLQWEGRHFWNFLTSRDKRGPRRAEATRPAIQYLPIPLKKWLILARWQGQAILLVSFVS